MEKQPLAKQIGGNQGGASDASRDVFVAAIGLSERERREYLDEHCRDNAELRRDVEALLESHDRMGSFLKNPRLRILGERSGDRQGANLDEIHATGCDLNEPERLVPGDQLGEYEVESFLARGGTGEVYRARQTSLGGRAVALKVLFPERLSWRGRERCQREAAIASEIHHPHLVTVYGCGEDDRRGLFYYAMRLVEGATLLDVLADVDQTRPNGSFQRESVSRCAEVADALAALHSRGLVHGDIKPANIILESTSDHLTAKAGGSRDERELSDTTGRTRAVLVDFGLIRRADQVHTTVWATPPYAAPEVLLGEPPTKRSDVFSLGVSLHDLLCCRGPEKRGVGGSWGGEVPPLSWVVPGFDRDLEAVVARSTDSDPERRYVDAGELAEDFRSWLRGEGVTARSVRGTERIRRWARRNPGTVLRWLTRVAVVGLLVGLTAFLSFQGLSLRDAVLDAEQYFQLGDLSGAAKSLREFRPVFDRFLLASELFESAEALRDPIGGTPIERVLQRLEALGSESEAEALGLAVAYVERDGPAEHPALARFLLHALKARQPGSGGLDLLQVVALLFYQRPDEDSLASEMSEGFRDRLLVILQSEDCQSSDLLLALTGLSGCGTGETIGEISRWLLSCSPSAEDRRELLAIGLRSLSRIIQRMHHGRRFETLAEIDREDFVLALSRRSREMCAGPLLQVRDALWNLQRTVNLARRASGLPPFPAAKVGLPGDPSPFALAAERNLGFWKQMIEAERLLGKGHEQYEPEAIGTVVALFDDREKTAAMEKVLSAQAQDSLFDPLEILDRYRKGFSTGEDLLVGIDPAWELDLDTHFGAAFDREDLSLQSVLWPVERIPEEQTVATWDFRERRLISSMTTPGLQLRKPSEDLGGEPGKDSYLRLGVPGTSEARLTFSFPTFEGRREVQASLQLVFQKSVRDMLPGAGEAELLVLFDDRIIGALHPSDGGLEPGTVPIPWVEGEQIHTITLKLGWRSTTTIWIDRAEIALVRSADYLRVR